MLYVRGTSNWREEPGEIVFVAAESLCYLNGSKYWIDRRVGHWAMTTIANGRQRSPAGP